MITLKKDSVSDLNGLIEDAVAYWVSECVDNGELVSGETAWKCVAAFATAKEMEFKGLFD